LELCRLRLITRYVLREIAVPSVIVFVVITFIAIGMEIEERSELLDFELLTLTDILLLCLYFLPTLVAIVIPYTFMMGILIAFGSLAQHREITAMRAAGIPLKRLIWPVLAIGAVLSVCAFALQDWGQPWGVRQMNRLIYEDLATRASIDVLTPGTMHVFGSQQWRVFIGGRDEATGVLRDIEIMAPQGDGTFWVYRASEAQVITSERGAHLRLRNGHLIMPDAEGYIARNTFPEWTVRLDEMRGRLAPPGRHTFSLRELLANEERMRAEYERAPAPRLEAALRGEREEIAKRLTWPVACLALAAMATPLAARPRGPGRSYSYAIGAVVGVVYYLLYILGSTGLFMPLWVTVSVAMIGNALFLVAGFVLTWRVDRV
jgi:lipopolysaccharide export system permease protein